MINLKNSGKILSIFLIILLLYNSFGFVAVHFVRLAKLKADVFESIRNSSFTKELIILTFSKAEVEGTNPVIYWLDKKEFRYKGEYYDIVKEKIEADTIYYFCIYDEKETLMDFLFVNHFEKQKDEKSSQKLSNGAILKFLTDYYINGQIIPLENFQAQDFLNKSDKSVICYFPDIPTPPPNITPLT